MLSENKNTQRPLWLESLIVVLVATAAMISMLPLLGVAKLFGIDMTKLSGLQFQFEIVPVLMFFVYGALAVLIVSLATKHLHKRRLSDLGFRGGFVVPIILGTFLGIGIKAGLIAVLVLTCDEYSFKSVIPAEVSWASYLAHYAYFLVGFITLNSFIEEFVTRGYPFAMLKERISPWVLTFVSAAVFTVGHFLGNKYSLPYAFELMMFGILFGYVYFLTDSIWAVVGLHNGINWTTYTFFGTNWKIGRVFETTISGVPQWVNQYSSYTVYIVAFALVWVFSKTKLFHWAFPNRASTEHPKDQLRMS